MQIGVVGLVEGDPVLLDLYEEEVAVGETVQGWVARRWPMNARKVGTEDRLHSNGNFQRLITSVFPGTRERRSWNHQF